MNLIMESQQKKPSCQDICVLLLESSGGDHQYKANLRILITQVKCFHPQSRGTFYLCVC